ncbi:SAM-dependent methyltransferase [Corallococcus interemptor]|uniref:HsdM family class I SAM-dependent methyltransferase n=1 Tax=Corallococcus interemptor TaxID=2316720 RepID=UPI0035D47DE8
MSSHAFKRALTATGYLTAGGKPAPGLVRATDPAAARLRVILKDARVGLMADAVFTAQSTPAAVFKDSGDSIPTDEDVTKWHEAAWNVGVAPLLWIVTPTEVRLYDCYASPPKKEAREAAKPLDRFKLDDENRLRTLDAMCGRLATETGAFWSSPLGAHIDRRHRVDRELLSEINALEEQLTKLPPSHPDSRDRTPAEEIKKSRDFAQRLIGRCIFTWYLIDRGLAQPFLPQTLPHDLNKLFGTPHSAFQLFHWLRETFNGDLFPMDDPGAEHTRLSEAHLALMRDFIQGRSLVPGRSGQGRLFRFRFDAIPVDLISSIYQQFARSSAEEVARVQGLHYTPVELVHLTLDPVFEGLPASARVIDPTCGSGAFLVEAFRRLVWANTGGKAASRALVRTILYKRLFGIDINRAALGIAAFSLYLAALELDEEPITDASDLKFDRLIGTTLFEANAIGDTLPPIVASKPFEAVVGNPPWTFDSQNKALPRKKGAKGSAPRPRRSPDQAFLNVAATLAGEAGRIGMVMKASPFFSRDEHAVEARNSLLQKLRPAAIVNLSALRKEELFPDADGPALLFFARCALMPRGDQVLVGSVPWTPDFRRNGVFHVGPGELRSVPLARVLKTPALLKAATFGTLRDSWLIERLEREFSTLDEWLDSVGIRATKSRGQGFQVKGDPNPPPKRFYELKTLVPNQYSPFRLDEEQLELFTLPTLHRPREEAIYNGPLLICPKASFTRAAEPGRYGAAISSNSLLYTENFYGISFEKHDSAWAHALCGILNSSLTAFQLAFGGGALGLERSTVEPQDLLSLRVPDLRAVDVEALTRLIRAEARAAEGPNPRTLGELDNAVGELYGLERDELVLAIESVHRSQMLLFEGRSRRESFVRPPQSETLQQYAAAVVQVVDDYLRAKGERHLEATIYARPLLAPTWDAPSAGLTTVRFTMVAGPPTNTPAVILSPGSELDTLAEHLRGKLAADLPPYLNERRQLRIYLQHDLYIVKPSESRYWSRTAGLNDADIILADHWLGKRNAARA